MCAPLWCLFSRRWLWTVSVVVGMDAELDELSVDNVIQCEERIIFQSRALLPDNSQGEKQPRVVELQRLLHPLGSQTRLVALDRANSLALCFICMTLAALMSLRDLWRSQQLGRIVESLFTFLSGASRKVSVKRLTWPLKDYERCLDFFGAGKGRQTVLCWHFYVSFMPIYLRVSDTVHSDGYCWIIQTYVLSRNVFELSSHVGQCL